MIFVLLVYTVYSYTNSRMIIPTCPQCVLGKYLMRNE